LQFWLHLKALLIKRFNYFKRDMKGFMFLIAIPLVIVLAIVGVLTVRSGFVSVPQTWFSWLHRFTTGN
jgi:hypothetical protein